MVADCMLYVWQTASSSFSGLGMQIRQTALIRADLGDQNGAFSGCLDME